MLCRRLEGRDRIVAGCRDTASDGRGLMIVLEDADVHEMLRMVEVGSDNINRFLQNRLDEVTH
jgi:hypothetical protein